MKNTFQYLVSLCMLLTIVSFSMAQQNNADTYQIQSSAMLLEAYNGGEIILKDSGETQTSLEIDPIITADQVTLTVDDQDIIIRKGEAKEIAGDVIVEVIAIEEDPYTKEQKAILEVKPIIQASEPAQNEIFDYSLSSIDLSKYGHVGGGVDFEETSKMIIIIDNKRYLLQVKLVSYDEATKMLTFEINGIAYQIQHSEFQDKHNWNPIEVEGISLYLRGQKGRDVDYNDAWYEIAMKPGFQIGSESSYFFSPIYKLHNGGSIAYQPAGLAKSSLFVTYHGTDSDGLMNIDFGKGSMRAGTGFMSSHMTTLFPVDRGEDWMSFTIGTTKFATSDYEHNTEFSETDLAIIDLSLDLAGPVKIVIQNVGKTAISQQQIPISITINEYNEQRTIDINQLQPDEIQTIIIPDLLTGIEFPNVKGTTASTYAPDYVGIVINPTAILNGNKIESRIDNNWFEVSFIAKSPLASVNQPMDEVDLDAIATKRILVTKNSNTIKFKGTSEKTEAFKVIESTPKNAVVDISGNLVNLEHGRTEIKTIENKYLAVSPLYFGQDEVLLELKVKEQNSMWEDPIVYSVQENQAFEVEADQLRPAQSLIADDTNNRDELTTDNMTRTNNQKWWWIGLAVLIILVILLVYKIYPRKSSVQ